VYLDCAFVAISTSFRELHAMQSCPDPVTSLVVGFNIPNILKYWLNLDVET
jgi:hypothetical protein